jgi:hypothetical protein
MTYYSGPQIGDEKPVGGGSNNKKNIGHEVFNFANFGGKLYGYVRAAEGRLNLERIDPTIGNADKLGQCVGDFCGETENYRVVRISNCLQDKRWASIVRCERDQEAAKGRRGKELEALPSRMSGREVRPLAKTRAHARDSGQYERWIRSVECLLHPSKQRQAKNVSVDETKQYPTS